MAEEKEGKKEQGQEETPQRKSLFNKFVEHIEKTDESWSNDNKKKGPRGRDLSPEEMKKKEKLAIDFYNEYGKDHLDDVESWSSQPKGQEILKHFSTDGRNADLYESCQQYRELADAFKKERGDSHYNYDEAQVAWDRVQTEYDIAFYVVLSGLPRFLISTTNQHTMGFVMTRFEDGKSISAILDDVKEKTEGKSSAKTEDKDKEKEDENAEEKEEKKEEKPEEKKEETPEEKKTKKRFVFSITKEIEDFGTRIAEEKANKMVAVIYEKQAEKNAESQTNKNTAEQGTEQTGLE